MPFQDAGPSESEHHEALYSGFAQEHFAKPAVRAFRRHLVARILRLTGASNSSRVLSLGCGIGDTELLLAPFVQKIVGLDLSPAGIRQARLDSERAGVSNAQFFEGDLESAQFPEAAFDIVIAVFFLHHLRDEQLHELVRLVPPLLSPNGVFYSLDPNRYRLSGAVGKLLAPDLMKKYQTPDERQLVPSAMQKLLAGHGFTARHSMYDFLSTPLAGLFPSARPAYRVARQLDNLLVRMPLLNRIGSNFELIARRRDRFR